MDFVGKVISLLFSMLSRLVIIFLPRSMRLLISWLQSPSAVILEPPKIKSDTVSTVSPSVSHEVMGPDAMIFVFWMLSLKPTFSLSSFTFIKRIFSFCFLPWGWCHVHIWGYWYFSQQSWFQLCFFQSSVSHDVLCIELNKQGDSIQKNKVWHYFHCFPIYFPWSDGTGCHDLCFLNVEL